MSEIKVIRITNDYEPPALDYQFWKIIRRSDTEAQTNVKGNSRCTYCWIYYKMKQFGEPANVCQHHKMEFKESRNNYGSY